MTSPSTPSQAASPGIRHAIYDYLRGRESLTGGDGGTPGILGSYAHPEIYPHAAPSRTEPGPHVVFKRADRPEQRTLTETRGVRGATFDFEVWGSDCDTVEAITEALRASLLVMPGARGNVHVRAVALEGEVDDAVRPDDGSEVTWFVTVVTARLSYIVDQGG